MVSLTNEQKQYTPQSENYENTLHVEEQTKQELTARVEKSENIIKQIISEFDYMGIYLDEEV